ncbi:hypothetical protein [Pseudomonas chlororaphis]|uniref:hypothetical protein n=1 Tax=Pseudomonas chlororaphis TaxID=587753 RepID=UPI0039E24249
MKSRAIVALNIKEVGSDWAAVDFVDKETGKFHRIYKYKNKPCKRVYIQSRLAEHLAGYSLIEKDLRSALVWLRKIDELVGEFDSKKDGGFGIGRDRETYNFVKGLFVAALTFYGKGFSKCEGRPVKLERNQLANEYRELHDLAISYRHNFAAHSGAKKLEFVKVALVVPLKVKPGKPLPMNLYTELNQPDLAWHSKDEELWLIELFEHARAMVKDKVKKLSERIMTEEVLPKDPSHFFK